MTAPSTPLLAALLTAICLAVPLPGRADCCCCADPKPLAPGASVNRPDPSAPDAARATTNALWQNDKGEHLRFSDLRGSPRVVALFYTTCHVVCPFTVENLQRLEARLDKAGGGGVGIVLVSLDPAQDTVQNLREYRRQHRLSARWTLLRGELKDTQNLAVSLGIPCRWEAYRLVHSPVLVVLDGGGRVVGQFPGLHPDLDAVVHALTPRAGA